MKMRELHQRALDAARRFFKAEAELLELIQRIDACKGFTELGHTSLFSYAVGELKLSESTALNLINVARKAVQVPALKTEIQAGNLSVCKARKIVPVLNMQNQVEWIEKAKTLPTRTLEKEIARVAPGVASPERVRYVSESRMSLSLTLDEKTMYAIKRVQDLESQKRGRAVTLEETLAAMSAFYVEKNDPVEKAKRAMAKAERIATKAEPIVAKTRPVYTDVTRQTETRRRPNPAAIEHQVALRDVGQCTEVDSKGARCERRRWLHIHHINPVSMGGQNTTENLTTLCSAHHQMRHGGQMRNDSSRYSKH
ncbi:MAG: HNH endonuclease [Deltaproteobacteria bacterium]|nr:HNH endonuclease [Deltaproteobacteria bacterium]